MYTCICIYTCTCIYIYISLDLHINVHIDIYDIHLHLQLHCVCGTRGTPSHHAMGSKVSQEAPRRLPDGPRTPSWPQDVPGEFPQSRVGHNQLSGWPRRQNCNLRSPPGNKVVLQMSKMASGCVPATVVASRGHAHRQLCGRPRR